MQDDVNNYESKEEMKSPKDHESPEIKNLAEMKLPTAELVGYLNV